MPTSERRAGRKLSKSDLHKNKLSYSQHSSDVILPSLGNYYRAVN